MLLYPNLNGLLFLLSIWAWVAAALPAETVNQTTPNTHDPFDFFIEGYRVQGYSDTSQAFHGANAFFALDDLGFQLREEQRRRGAFPGLQRTFYTNDARELIHYAHDTPPLSFGTVNSILHQIRLRLERDQARYSHPVRAYVSLNNVLKFDVIIDKILVESFALDYERWHSICYYYPSRPIPARFIQGVIGRLRTWPRGRGRAPSLEIPQIDLPEFSTAQRIILDATFDPEGRPHWTRIRYGELVGMIDLLLRLLEGPPPKWFVFDCTITTQPFGGLTAGRIIVTNQSLGEEEGEEGEELPSSSVASQAAASASATPLPIIYL
ncbi:MAG: hypothetical protein LQ351_004435 [Letrouitia transgressa]|nr:MAG: hypothetical protein LQ351_004435 [Letrouitia transgressa]